MNFVGKSLQHCATALILSVPYLFPSLEARAADSPAPQKEQWRVIPLVENGHVAEGWVHVGWGGFTVEGDTLKTECDSRGLGLLLCGQERFGNCQIRVVFKVKDRKSNSGVIVRLPDAVFGETNRPGAAFERVNGKITAQTIQKMMESAEREEGPWFAVHRGYEIQIMDDNDRLHRTGAVYSLAPSSAALGQPGEWRSMLITLDGNKIMVDVDGKRVTNFDPAKAPVRRERKWFEPKLEQKRPDSGFLALQNHDPGDVVWFKEVSVRPLSSSTPK